ncbi:hypothetical protein [Conexibacter sp. SYSU D00693]|uniref:hypothetical protein n=1 Tax=Conexibacter sp. SYSU D00693 TaxID=2812560 RepID=UPI00196B1A63|nr:hypothetical protein [Conexibacter sp. SYSU D00693]
MGMTLLRDARRAPRLGEARATHAAHGEVRCRCADCGAHVAGWQGYSLTGWCANCGSYEVEPLAPASTPVAAPCARTPAALSAMRRLARQRARTAGPGAVPATMR